ncbi:DUF5011 domain-containing protein [Thalassotalea sp. M1531]|uniref:DUF5011 domain-containing protein n=1 Tax=Thalassotalea algicola TaxID=2716224 RepID=A0A7Y0LDH3_9GAMM|nr:immunoglobulin-like domain-containing protein [Thalassotalea algicola]NMP31621.1 DUF5011 domain-containing protein [Thalassotalea algicola]
MIRRKTAACVTASIALAIFLNGCNTEGAAEGLVPTTQTIAPEDIWWKVPFPDLETSDGDPDLTLVGQNIEILNINEDYIEKGAVGIDEKDGDISHLIKIEHNIDTNSIGDYIVRYTLTDSDGNHAVEINRIVRVYNEKPESLSHRPILSTQANFGYLEHLPADYGLDPDKKYPLLIYNHGNGVNTERTGTDPINALNYVADNGGPPTLMQNGQWDETLPFIVLTPHFGFIDGYDNVFRFNVFVEYALHTYNVDTSRVYFAGWSQGGLASYDYTTKHADKVAAVVSVSGGYPYGNTIPREFCDIENTPIWLFHGTSDEVIAHGRSVSGYNKIIDNCQPTTLPKLTLVEGADHNLHDSIFSLSGLAGGSSNYQFDSRYDEYSPSVYQWLLSHSKTQD